VTVNRKNGGAEGDRTLDLCIANAALSQLSYRPTDEGRDCKEPPQGQQAIRREDGRGQLVYRSGPMKVRDATLADLDFIAASHAALAAEMEEQELDPSLLRPGIRAVLTDPVLARYYIAELEGKAAGQLMTTYEWSDWRNGLFLWIQSVYVMPDARGLGVFRALYGHLEELARTDQRICGIRLYVDRANDRAFAVYARLGMHRSNYRVMETIYRGPESRG
jgi:GNAT superfamily N-acetyltransferase